ncbi:MAG: hypothetical protein HKP38_00405 [Croceitalea sp.]|nr:hypothetical protein [Croceitalea sp.]MBT8237901.1 hypothetical protein [Croceitalea sp.]NNC34186.1 hypothetical protein [Croceitalea sp.]NNL07662.1 hypothetical protein [Croceitalea sp.]NNM17118.1 hypothetical protein [Croceitalea sp.]
MENQNCKVGAVTPITSVNQAATVLEYRYQYFLEMASATERFDNHLREFFQSKAEYLKKILENLA